MVINLIDRVKYSFRKDKELISALYAILGFYPHDLKLYRVALAHKSQAYRTAGGASYNNERLEFLGDAVLETVVSDILFHRYERRNEGFLTSTRSKIVQRTSLNRLAAEIGLDRLIKASTASGVHHNNIGGNAFEALVGAIYLDRGYSFCRWFVEKRIVGRLLDLDGVAKKEVNFKSKLLEWTQKNRIIADYKMSQKEGQAGGETVFTSTVVIEGVKAGTGTGHSKKESHQAAAREALVRLRREPKLLEAIYTAKEQRTAMEAPEICAVPRIDELEEDSAAAATKGAGRAAGRGGRRAPQRPAPSPQQDMKKQRPARKLPKAPVVSEETVAAVLDEQAASRAAEAEQRRRPVRQPQADADGAAVASEAAAEVREGDDKKPARRRSSRGGRGRRAKTAAEAGGEAAAVEPSAAAQPASEALPAAPFAAAPSEDAAVPAAAEAAPARRRPGRPRRRVPEVTGEEPSAARRANEDIIGQAEAAAYAEE